MNEAQKNELGEQSIGRLLLTMAVPAITAQVVNVLYNIVDRIYIGHIPEIGSAALTGVGVTLPLILIISAFASLIGMGGAPRASIMLGRCEHQTAEKILGNCTAALIAVSVALTVVVLVFGERMLLLFGGSENTLRYAMDYMSIYACGTVFVQLSLGLNAFINAQGFAGTGMLTVAVGAVSNIILDPILIFGFGMGVRGAALATILSQAISAGWVLLFLTGKKSLIRIKREHLRIDRRVLLPCVALGLSPFIMKLTDSLLYIAFNSSLQRYGGDLAVGSMTIVSSVMQFAMLPLTGLAQAAQPIISFNYGAGKALRVRQAFRLLLTASLTYSAVLWLIIMLFPGLFAGMFTSNAELIRLSVPALRTMMAASLFIGIQYSCQHTFLAIGNARASIFLALLRKVFLLIPLIYILPLFVGDRVWAVFLAEPVADMVAFTVTGVVFAIQFRRIMRTIRV